MTTIASLDNITFSWLALLVFGLTRPMVNEPRMRDAFLSNMAFKHAKIIYLYVLNILVLRTRFSAYWESE